MTTTILTLLDIRVVLDLPESLARRVESLFGSAAGVGHNAAQTPIHIAARRDASGIRLTGCGPDVTVTDEPTALAHILSRINISVLGAAPYLGIHAGVVAFGQHTVAFPAASGAGKSTLVAAALQAGMSYVSDEALCLNWTTGEIAAYPRPIELSVDSCRLLGLTPDNPAETPWSPAMLGARQASLPLVLTQVILLDDSNTGLEPTSRGAGVAELLTRSFNHWHNPERAFDLVHALVRSTQVWRMGRWNPAASAAKIVALMQS